MKCNCKLLPYLFSLMLLHACTTTGPAGLFGKRSPHEQYGQSLVNAGLKNSALGRAWFAAAEQSISKPLQVTIPYKESGYFAAEKARAISVRFEVKRGEKLTVSLEKQPASNFTMYVDLWEVKNNNNKKLVAYADTGGKPFSYETDDTGFYIVRVQPELFSAGEYTLIIANGPSLAFPIKNGKIGSFWGADRDGGARRHEGIDIFAPRGTPTLAAADGTISRVTTNQLGGKVIFMRPANKNYSLYYAHLDEQLVSAGQNVKTGDTIGLVGNTGNAISTSPHLHFGIYTFSGAIDPLVFVNPVKKPILSVKASLANNGKSMRTGNASVTLREGLETSSNMITKLPPNTLVTVSSASDNSYRVELPDGSFGFLNSTSLQPALNPLRQTKLTGESAVLDKPSSTAARKTLLPAGTVVSVLGTFESFAYIKAEENWGWINFP